MAVRAADVIEAIHYVVGGVEQSVEVFHLVQHAERPIKNTSGVPEDRFIIRTRMRLGRRLWTIDLSLSDRSAMTFPMIVGRAALKNHAIAVHTRRTHLVTPRPGASQDTP